MNNEKYRQRIRSVNDWIDFDMLNDEEEQRLLNCLSYEEQTSEISDEHSIGKQTGLRPKITPKWIKVFTLIWKLTLSVESN